MFQLLGNSKLKDDLDLKDDLSELTDETDNVSDSYYDEPSQEITTPAPIFLSSKQSKIKKQDKKIKNMKKIPLNIERLEEISEELKTAYDHTLKYKNEMIANITDIIDEVINNHSTIEDANSYIFKNRLQNIILRTPGSNAEGCIKGKIVL